MIETTIPEINLDELMARVRAKAEEIRRLEARPKLPTIGQLNPTSRAVLPKPVVPKTENIVQAMNAARRANSVSRWIPKPLRGLFRRQERFNREAIRSIEWLAQTNTQLAERLRHLAACVAVQDHSIEHLADLRRQDGDWMRSVSEIIVTADERLFDLRSAVQTDIDTRVSPLQQELAALRAANAAQIESQAAELATTEAKVEAAVASIADRFDQERAALETHFNTHLEFHQNELDNLAAAANACRSDVAGANERLDRLAAEVTMIRDLASGIRGEFDQTVEDTKNLRQAFAPLQAHRAELLDGLARSGERLRRLQDDVDNFRATALAFRGELDRAGEHLRNLQAHVDRLTAEGVPLHSSVNELLGEFRVIRDEFNRAGEHLRNLQSEFDRSAAFHRPQLVEQTIARLEQRLTDDGSYVKAELSNQRAVIADLLSNRSRKNTGQQRTNGQRVPAVSDAFYVSFEDRFRGSRRDIKARQAFYLPWLTRSEAGTRERPVLDIGCGRGEWLELLGEHKQQARGVDVNATMVAHCTERRLNVVQNDAVSYLKKLKSASLGAITGFHIIEHLSLEVLLQIFALTYRALKPGGVAIFESPNCKNLVVGACNFNIDPTHRNPIHPETAEFMLTAHGFTNVETHFLSPVEGTPFTEDSAASQFLNDRLFGAQDFGVIGYKPAAG